MNMHFWEMPPQRPPSEAYSLLIRATRNCPWSRCEFCGNYRGAKFAIRTVDEVTRDISAAKAAADEVKDWAVRIGCGDQLAAVARANGIPWLDAEGVRSVFIGDADSPVIKIHDFVEILTFLAKTFPDIGRVTTYARANTLLRKRPEELKLLRDAGLTRLHVGLESGDDEILTYVHKGPSADEMIRAGEKAMEAGFELSLYVMPGLGGTQRWEQHVRGTARVLNRIDPHFIRLRTLNLTMVPNAPLFEKSRRGEFCLPSLSSLVAEVRVLVEELDVSSELIANDFAMNYYLLDLDGKLPKSREKMLLTLEEAMTMAVMKEKEQARTREERLIH